MLQDTKIMVKELFVFQELVNVLPDTKMMVDFYMAVFYLMLHVIKTIKMQVMVLVFQIAQVVLLDIKVMGEIQIVFY